MNVYPSSDIEQEAGASGRCEEPPRPLARIAAVKPESPADDAGFYPGCAVTSVDGCPVRDIIDWRWLTAADEIEVGYLDAEGDEGAVVLEREEGESWGFEFEGAVFDGVRLCRNACTFCFMRQLPPGMRSSLALRDDDFRLSFLQGTFVTFTNLSAADEARIVAQRISPLRFSLQAATPEVRAELIGRHAAHGLAAAERLLAAGIELHAQIVLVPGANDGEELDHTLEWAYAHPGILTVGIVPLGYTRHQSTFDHSFNDREAARAVLAQIARHEARALAERGTPWVYAADEFYRNAYPDDLIEHLPPASFFGEFDMFEDGIGIVRSFVDDWESPKAAAACGRMMRALEAADARVLLVAGCAQREFLDFLVARAGIAERFCPVYVENAFFGGNVDVTGLLTGDDVVRALRNHPAASHGRTLAAILSVMLNDDGLTLDGWDVAKLQSALPFPLAVVSCNASEYFEQIAAESARLWMNK